MEKRFGSPKRQDGLMKVGRNKYDLFFGFGKENEEDTSGWNYYHRFTHRPTLDEIKAVINRQIDADTDETILHGMTWEGKPVKLDSESQTNLLGLLLSAQGGMATWDGCTMNGARVKSGVYYVFASVSSETDSQGDVVAKILVVN